MRITVTFELSGHLAGTERTELQQMLSGPLETGTDQANYQLAAEGKAVRLRLISGQINEAEGGV